MDGLMHLRGVPAKKSLTGVYYTNSDSPVRLALSFDFDHS
jgi:hypothetical protein